MRLDDKTVLITGSTDGVGRRVAVRLGEMGARVLVHGRDRARGDSVVAEIRARGNTAAFYQANLSSLAEVRRLAERVRAEHPRLDVLINNAGIGSAGAKGPRQESADGHELRFAVNYLAGFLLTHLLLPTLRASAPARIVNVASAGQHPIDFDDVMLTRGYSGGRAYTQSKLAQVMMTLDLARELAGTGVTVNCLPRRPSWTPRWCARPAPRRSARSRKARMQSSTSRSRPLSKAAPAAISIASRSRAQTHKPMTRRRSSSFAR
jgi:NAD(P)-dependent dehydrogenase (short-subunit alcohol dehydrogenase family)